MLPDRTGNREQGTGNSRHGSLDHFPSEREVGAAAGCSLFPVPCSLLLRLFLVLTGRRAAVLSTTLRPPQRAVLRFLELDPETETLRREELVDLLERLLSEVVDAEHLLLRPLHEIPDGLDVLLLEA